MSSDTYDRTTVEPTDSRGRIKRTFDTLQNALSQTVETVTRQARFEISGGGVDTVDAPDNLDELVDEAKKVGFVWRAFDIFSNEVWEPGYRFEGPDETLAFLLGDQEDLDASPPEGTPEGGFLENCGVHAGVKQSPFYHVGKQATFQRRLRGTVLIELLKEDTETPIPETKITGFNFVRPETVSAETYPYSNILIEPEDTDVDGVDITRRGEAAAYIQWEDSSILGRQRQNGLDNEEIPLSKNDLKKQVLNPGIGDDASEEQGIFGTSEIEPISEDIAEYRQIKRDRATAIQNKAHGQFFIEHGREVVDLGDERVLYEWDDESMNDFEDDLSAVEPGGYVTHDGSVNVDRKTGEVPDLTETMSQIVDDIFAGLPVPKYKVGFSDDINRDVTSEQSSDSEKLASEERQYQERWWTEQFKLVAESWGLPTEGLKLRIEPEPQDSPVLSMSAEEIDKLSTYAQALNALAGPRGGPQTLVDTETLLTDIAQLPESVNDVDDIDPENTENPDAMGDFLDVMGAEIDTLQEFDDDEVVDTPDGVGVIDDIITEGTVRDMDASSETPVYAVVVEDGRVGVGFYRESDLSSGSVDDLPGPENPEEDISEGEETDTNQYDAYQEGFFSWPESWQESSQPARIIALKAWAGMGGSFDACTREMRGEIVSPDRFCADFKDRLYGTEDWRGGWAD